MRVLLALGCLLAASCYDVEPGEGRYTCRSSGLCPEGMTCQCGECWRGVRPGCDCGCAIGSRAPSTELRLDHHDKRKLCFCSAAWDIGGVEGKSPSCGRAPAAASGRGCTIEDSCAAGWHVCGLDAAVASALGNLCAGAPPGAWVTSSGIGYSPPLCSSAPGGSCVSGCNGGRSAALATSSFPPPWACTDSVAPTLTRGDPAGEGGVMCCEDG